MSLPLARDFVSVPPGAAAPFAVPLNLSGDALVVSTLTVESSQNATQAAPLVLLDANNAAFDEPVLKVTNSGVGAAVRLEGNGTLSSNTRNVLEVVGAETWDATTLGVSGFQDDLGTIKISHTKPLAGADTNAAALSIKLNQDSAAGASSAQGVFIDTDASHTSTAKLLNLRNSAVERLTLTAQGLLTLGRASSGDNLLVNNNSANRTAIAVNANAAQQALVEFRDGGTTKWQIGKQNAPLDFFLFNNSAAEMALTAAIGGGQMNLMPNVGDVRIGSTAAPTATLSLDGGSQAARTLDDIDDGDNWTYSTNDEGVRWRARLGTVGAPDARVGVGYKFTRIQDATGTATDTGTDPSLWATVGVISTGRAGTTVQATAIFAYANTEATVPESFPIDNPDATAIIAIGNVHTNGTGNALGIYAEAAMNSIATPSGQGQGQAGEFQVRNNAADAVYSASNLALAKGIFITTSGTKKVNAACAIGKSSGADFLVGILIASGAQGNAVQDASFRDEGDASYALHVKGSHPSGALVMDNTSGGFIEFIEMTDPAAPTNTHSRLYTRLNGGGKTELCVRFNTGAIQILATEP